MFSRARGSTIAPRTSGFRIRRWGDPIPSTPRPAAAPAAGAGDDSRRGEELLGQLEVDFGADRDVLQVGRDEGRFQKIRLVVRGGSIELRDATVTFDDNSISDPESRTRILREDSSIVFDLPGQRRVIKSIAFQYRSLDR